MLLLLLLLLSGPAEADDAELQRLRAELHNLAGRASWTGVDRTYRALVDLAVPLAPEDHLAGYQAALQDGEALLALHRVSRVAGDEGPTAAEAQRARAALLEGYGLVAIVAPPGRRPELQRPEMPFAPDQRAAILRASVVLMSRGELRALLPVGRYLVDGRTFDVRPGERWQTLVLD